MPRSFQDFGFGAAAGQRQEHLVEAGAAQVELGDPDPGVLEPPHHAGQHVLLADRDRDRRIADLRLGQREPGHDRHHGRHVGRVGRADAQRLRPGPGLELVRRPGRDDRPVVDDGDILGELIGFFQVLRSEQDGNAGRGQPADHVPHLVAAERVKPGRRLIEVEHPGARDQAGGQVQPPSHAARIGLHRPEGGVGEPESGQQLARPAPGRGPRLPGQPPDKHQVLGPGKRLVHRRVLPGEPGELPDLMSLAHHVVPAHAGVSPSGRTRVASIRTAVVFPAPFSPNTEPVRTARSIPSSATVSPYRLTSPSAMIE
jgi:hypothetical protein